MYRTKVYTNTNDESYNSSMLPLKEEERSRQHTLDLIHMGDMVRLSNRERTIYNRLNQRTRIGGHDLLRSSMEGDLMNLRLQHEALIKQNEAYIGCDPNGFVNYVPNSILCTKYSMTSELGRGTFSRVFKCKNRVNKKQYAVKIIRNSAKYQLAAKHELAVLIRIAANDVDDTSCCIHIMDCDLYFVHPMFVFPLLSTSLRSWMNTGIAHKPFSFEQITHFMWQMCRGIAFIHSLRIINTDLKPDNIMLINDQTNSCGELTSTDIKIIDFGSAVILRKEGRKYHHLVQTRQYRAPEVILGLEWSYAVDIWSLGCILVELMHGKLLFPCHSDVTHLHRIIQCIGVPPNHLLPAIHDKTGAILNYNIMNMKCRRLKTYFVNERHNYNNAQCAKLYDLCTKMLRWNPTERITAKAALQHPALRKEAEIEYF